MHRLLLVALVVALFFAGPAHGFNLPLYAPAITACDSYPFPSCRARSLCNTDGGYWYDGQCHRDKHPDYAALEKLDGHWRVTYHYTSGCGGEIGFGGDHLHFDKSRISDDNIQVAQFEGNAFSIPSPYYQQGTGEVPPTDTPPYYRYAMVGTPPYSYVFKIINTSWGAIYSVSCHLPDGTEVNEKLEIKADDTGIHSFNLVADNRMEGRACFVKANTCLNFTGEPRYRF